MWERLRRFIVRVLLLPILPALAWGPATHPYINKRALEIAEAEVKKGNPAVNREIVVLLTRNRDTYIFGGNSADAISSYHILSGMAVYDYAHNYFPDTASGTPVFGYKLVDEWYRSRLGEREAAYPEVDFAIACGWLSHQLADWYAHHAPIDREGRLPADLSAEVDEDTVFPGYSNSHRVLGADYYPEILQVYNTADHALIEFFHDMLLIHRYEQDFLKQNRVELFETRIVAGKPTNLLTQASEQYEGMVSRIPAEQILTLKDDFNRIIQALKALNDIVVHLNPRLVTVVSNSIDSQLTGKPDYIELSIERVLRDLFCLSFEEIARRATQMVCHPAGLEPVLEVRESARAGTILFGLAERLTRLVDPELAVSLVKDPNSLNVRLLWGLVDLRAGIIRNLVRMWATTKLPEYLAQDFKLGALLTFITELVQGRNNDFTVGQQRFQRHLPPLVQFTGFHGTAGSKEWPSLVSGVEIGVRVVPAVLRGRPDQNPKTIDPTTLCFAVNGFDVQAKPESLGLEQSWAGHRLLLKLRVSPGFCPGVHHLLVTVRDRSAAPAGRLEQELHVRREV
ncbi:MAG: hypothetical protein M0028_04505 [Clostridia bacterium]|nr:hypothetical protein [Clostridia bacterium]